jgi:predicted SnoaL-like aldol condensation-catalyzing enzyme
MSETQASDIAVEFLKLVIKGSIDEAYDRYVSPGGKHHNVHTAAGFDALRKGMKDNDLQFPNKQFEIKHVVSDGAMTTVYSHLVMKPGDTGIVVVHMFCIKDDKIIELWDCGQAIPEDSPNSDGPF